MLGDLDGFLILWALVCIIVVLAMSYWVTRYVAGKGLIRNNLTRRNGGQIQVLAQEVIGRDQRLLIVRVGEKHFLVGVTPNAISLLSEISWDETASDEDAAEQEAKTNPSFFEAFSSALKERVRR